MLNPARTLIEKTPVKWALRVIGTVIAGYGVYALIKRDLVRYMFLKTQFVFFDFEEPLIFFILDYIAIMGLFVFAGHYISAFLRQAGRKKSSEN